MACAVNFADFDEAKYAGQEKLTGAVRAKTYAMIGQSLEELAPISIMLKAAWDGRLAKTVYKEETIINTDRTVSLC